ncbi:right-handed parallel beta-helix repeat-containing protein [Spirosoma radiotolerans]|nr:right-handed parallel beta-helix repeat-containing protein [Spirosoma radiotolerans]
MRKILFSMLAGLSCLTSFAQTTTKIGTVYESIRPVFPGNPDEFAVTLDPSDSAKAVTVQTYYVTGGQAATPYQPTVTRSGRIITVRFPNVSLIPAQARIKLKIDNAYKQVWRYDVSESNTVKTAPDNMTIVNAVVAGTDSFTGLKGVPSYLSADTISKKANRIELASKFNINDTTGKWVGKNVYNFDKSTTSSALAARVVHVADINALNNTPGNASTSVVVRDKIRGGTFVYAASGTVDNGITFSEPGGGVWVRLFDNKIQAAWYVLNGNGVTYDNISIQKAIDAQSARGGGSVELPNGTFLLNAALLPRSKVELTGQGDGTVLLQNSNAGVINAQGTVSPTSYSMVIQPLRSQQFIRTTVTSPFVAGDWIRVRSEDIWLSNSDGNKQAFIVRVARVNGDSTILMNPLPENYTLATAKVEKVIPISNFTLSNLKLKNIPNTRLVALTTWNFCSELRIVNVSAEGSDEAGFDIQNTWESEIDRVRCTDFIDDPNNGRYGYGIGFSGACYNVITTNCTFRNVRHATTTLGSSGVYGVPRNMTFSNCHSSESSLTHFDSHQLGEEILYIGCTATGGKSKVSFGFQIRNRQASLVGCTAYNTTGAGFYIINGSINKYTTMTGCVASQVRYGPGFIITNGANVNIVGGRASECDYQGILISGVNSPSSVHIQGMAITDNNRILGTSDGIYIDASTGGVTVDNCIIGRVASFTTWNHRYGVNVNNSSSVTISNNKFKANGTASYSISGTASRAYKNKFDDVTDVNYLKELEIVSGTGAPAIVPGFFGQRFIDTVNKKVYEAAGTSSSADWIPLN